MCHCVVKVNEMMAKRGQNQQCAPAYRFQGGVFTAAAVVATERIDAKKRQKDPRLVATFCPFCGKKYPE